MPGPTVIDLAMLSRQRLASEVRQHLSRGAFLAPGPFLNGEQNVVVQADCCAHARDASARMPSQLTVTTAVTVTRLCVGASCRGPSLRLGVRERLRALRVP